MLASSRGTPRCRRCRGRDKSLPYDQRWTCGQTGQPQPPDGRRAGCPHPAGPCAVANTHGRIWNPPLRNGKVRGQPGSRTLCDIANLCRGRCLHRPEDLAPPQVSAGGINPSPTTNGDRTAATTRTSVGRDALIPPGPAAKQPPNFELQRQVRRAATFSRPPAFFLHPARAPRIGMGGISQKEAGACVYGGGRQRRGRRCCGWRCWRCPRWSRAAGRGLPPARPKPRRPPPPRARRRTRRDARPYRAVWVSLSRMAER